MKNCNSLSIPCIILLNILLNTWFQLCYSFSPKTSIWGRQKMGEKGSETDRDQVSLNSIFNLWPCICGQYHLLTLQIRQSSVGFVSVFYSQAYIQGESFRSILVKIFEACSSSLSRNQKRAFCALVSLPYTTLFTSEIRQGYRFPSPFPQAD